MAKLIVFSAVVLLCGCAMTHQEDRVPSNQHMVLPDMELNTLERKAESGDAAAAFRLFQHYEFGEFDYLQSLRWLRVAASLGHVIAQFNLGYLLVSSDRQEDKKEGVKWLRTAADAGYERASEVLHDIGK